MVVTVAQYTIGVSVEAEDGQAVEAVQPWAIALARMVVTSLR